MTSPRSGVSVAVGSGGVVFGVSLGVGSGCEAGGVLGVDSVAVEDPGATEGSVGVPEDAPTGSRGDSCGVLTLTGAPVTVEALDGAEVVVTGGAVGLGETGPSPLALAA